MSEKITAMIELSPPAPPSPLLRLLKRRPSLTLS